MGRRVDFAPQDLLGTGHDQIGHALLQTRQFLSGAQGDAESVHAAGQSVRDWTVPEFAVDEEDWEDHIIEDDFLKMNLHRLFDGKPFVLTGNYPYNISSQIFFKMLDNKDIVPCCTGMIQKEVAERIAAGPGSKTYGILSVLIQAWYKVEYLFTVSEHVFNPPPKVKSAVIRMTRNETKELGCDEKLFKQVVKTTFNQRRKTLRNSIKPILGKDCPLTEDILFNKRPEQLSVAEFIDLTNKVEEALKTAGNAQ